MRISAVSLALCSGLLAQTSLLEPEHLAARTRVAATLDALADGDAGLSTTIALAATAGTGLVAGSGARAELESALVRANTMTRADAALRRLRIDLGDLADTLTFEPVGEADLPAGFPGYRAVGEIELRRYPGYRLARTAMRGGGSNGAFWPLFQHIKDNGIAMTAPVQTDYEQREGAAARPRTMAFLYGDSAITPDTVSDRVEVVDVPAATVLSIGARGNERRATVQRLEQALRDFVAANGDRWQVAGPMRLMGYNSPMVRGDRRYFEVQLPVQARPVLR